MDIPIIVVKHPNPEQLEKYCKHSTEALVVRTKRNEQRIEKDKLLKKKLEHDKLLFEQTKANSSDRKGLNKQMDEEIFSDLGKVNSFFTLGDCMKESKAEIEFKRKDTDTFICPEVEDMNRDESGLSSNMHLFHSIVISS